MIAPGGFAAAPVTRCSRPRSATRDRTDRVVVPAPVRASPRLAAPARAGPRGEVRGASPPVRGLPAVANTSIGFDVITFVSRVTNDFAAGESDEQMC
jgi:hypothetical protein